MTSSYISGPFIDLIKEYLKAEQTAVGNVFANGLPRYLVVENSRSVDDIPRQRQLKNFFLNLAGQIPNGLNILFPKDVGNEILENSPEVSLQIDPAQVCEEFTYTDSQGDQKQILAVFSGYPEQLEIRGSVIIPRSVPRLPGITEQNPNSVSTNEVPGYLIITGFNMGPRGTVLDDNHKLLILMRDGDHRPSILDFTTSRNEPWLTIHRETAAIGALAFAKAAILYQNLKDSEWEMKPRISSVADNMQLIVKRKDIPLAAAPDLFNIPKIIPRDHWTNSQIGFDDISEEIVANSVIVAAMQPLQFSGTVPSVQFISAICDAFRIDQSVLEARGFNKWRLTACSNLVAEQKYPKINHNASTLTAEFISHAREILLHDAISSSKISAVAENARLYKVGRSRLGRKFTELENQLSSSIVEIWAQAACVHNIRTLNFKTPRAKYNGGGVMYAGIDINPILEGQDQNPITANLITPNIIDYCTIENSTDDATGIGFTLIIGSENPILMGSTASLSVSNPHRIPRPFTI
jgi:hypothetical protein